MNDSTGLLAVLVLVALAIVLGTVGTMDRHDAEQQAQHCQQLVKQDVWPSEVCEEK